MVQGVIGRIRDTQAGSKTFYSFVLNGQDGWYGSGIKRPPSVGTSVRFNSKKNSKGYLEVDGGIEVITDGAAESAPSVNKFSRAGGVPNQNGTSMAYWDRKEARDVHNDELREIGASRNTALNIIDLMIKHEAIKLPTAAKREEFIWELLDKYTDKLRGKTKSEGSEDAAGQEALSSAQSDDPEADGWN